MDELVTSAAYVRGFEDCQDKVINVLEDLKECAIDSRFDFDYGNYELVEAVLIEHGLI